jgi:ketosteroid isomerase-like protein
MKSLLLLLFFIAGSSHLLAQSSGPSSVNADQLPSVTLPPEIDRVLRDYERAWKAKDTKALVALFVSDGFVMQPQRPPVRGHAGLEQAYRGAGGPLYLRALSFAQSGSVGYIIGAYRYQETGTDIGKFILALRQGTNNRWFIAADMDNSIK